jgi:Fe-S-cluster containining protein
VSDRRHRAPAGRRPRRPAGPAAPIPGPVPGDVLAALDAVYATLPKPQCKGLCADSCHNPTVTAVERRRITDAGGPPIPPPRPVPELERTAAVRGGRMFGDDTRCPALSSLGTCSVYSIRPLLCRAFGATDTYHLRCEHGCTTEADSITFPELLAMLVQVEKLSRAVTGEPVIPLPGDPE